MRLKRDQKLQPGRRERDPRQTLQSVSEKCHTLGKSGKLYHDFSQYIKHLK